MLLGVASEAAVRILGAWGAAWVARCPPCPSLACPAAGALACPELHCPSVTCASAQPCPTCPSSAAPAAPFLVCWPLVLLALAVGGLTGCFAGLLCGTCLRRSRPLAIAVPAPRGREIAEQTTEDLVASQSAWLLERHGASGGSGTAGPRQGRQRALRAISSGGASPLA